MVIAELIESVRYPSEDLNLWLWANSINDFTHETVPVYFMVYLLYS